ncbi:hypothetical protein [Microcoleus phage My-WqHQDG]|nr:hypothetical protein [Microcoleus phage My-WqHQDG]
MTTEENNQPYRDPFPNVLGSLVFYRTYSDPGVDPNTGKVRMQTWEENAQRNAQFLGKLGGLTPEQTEDIYKQQCALVVTPPGRVLWAAKEAWVNKPGKANYLGLFNCVGVRPTSWRWLELEFLLLMMGCGVGSVVEEDNVSLFPPINEMVPELTITHQPGEHSKRPENTTYSELYSYIEYTEQSPYSLTINVGDSKEGWASAYRKVLEVCSDTAYNNLLYIYVDLGGVRPNGEPIKGFGGTANPIGLPQLFEAVITILRGAAGRQLTAAELCLLENEAAKATVAGNIRRSARWGGSSLGSPSMTGIKDNLWSQDADGKWVVDEKRDALRMTNLSTIFHRKPTLEECVESVQKQYDTGEGALWYAPAALVRTNVDVLPTKDEQWAFEHAYTTLGKETGRAYLRGKLHEKGIADSVAVEKDLDHRMMRYGANPCCLVAGTLVLTRTGDYAIEDLEGVDGVEVWDGERWVQTKFYMTGVDQEVYQVQLEDGSAITATGYHKFILTNGQRVTLLGLVPGNTLMGYSLEDGTGPYPQGLMVIAIVPKGIADKVYCCNVRTNNLFALSNGVLVNNCEILGTNFVCSLSQVDLSRFDTSSPTLWKDIDTALDTAALIVCALLKRGFDIPELQGSRDVDPIVAVTLNGVFDFMVNLYGEPWLRWWMEGCPEYWKDILSKPSKYIGGWHSQHFIAETEWILNRFRDRVRDTVTAYCTEHSLRVPNRYTAMQPSGSKSCLTGGTPACYTPKAAYWVRRITLRRDHPVALAAIDYGYKVVPSSSCRDEDGVMLDNPYDERVTEWMVEVPDKCTWSSNVDGEYDVAQAPITSQWYLTMACQKHFVTHNTSCTFEINKDEVSTLAGLIHEEIQDGGDYVSAAIFARDGHTMPRMPYEPITREKYEYMEACALTYRNTSAAGTMTFKDLVEHYHNMSTGVELGPIAGCDGDSCTVLQAPNTNIQATTNIGNPMNL